MMSGDLPALMSDGLENLLIDEIELCPTEQNNPEVTLDLLEQGLAPDHSSYLSATPPTAWVYFFQAGVLFPQETQKGLL